MAEPSWLTADEVILINQTAVESTGSSHFLRDSGGLDMALSRPINKFHYEQEEDLVTLARELVFGIAKAHAFEDGNKRTAYGALYLFMLKNGYEFQPFDHPTVAMVIEGIAASISGAIPALDTLIEIYSFPISSEVSPVQQAMAIARFQKAALEATNLENLAALTEPTALDQLFKEMRDRKTD